MNLILTRRTIGPDMHEVVVTRSHKREEVEHFIEQLSDSEISQAHVYMELEVEVHPRKVTVK